MGEFKRDGKKAILGGILLAFILGSLYLWSTINIYVATYLSYNSSDRVDVSTINQIFPFLFTSSTIANFLVQPISKKLGIRNTSLLCSFMITLSVFIASFAKSLAVFVIFYGVIQGFFQGLLILIPIYNAFRFFPDKRGLIGGIIFSAVGFGSFTFTFIAKELINPHNDSLKADGLYSKEIGDNLPFALRILCIIYVCLLFPGSFLMKTTEEVNTNLEDSTIFEKEELLDLKEKENEQFNKLTFKSCFRQPVLYLIMIQSFCLSSLGMLMTNNFKYFGLQQINDDSFMTLIGSMSSIFNSLSRPFWGYVSDKIQFRYISLINLLFQFILGITLEHIAYSKSLYMIWILLIYSMYGGVYVIMPNITMKIFGQELGEKLYGFVYLGLCLSAWVQFLIVETSVNTIGYEYIFVIYAIFAFCGFFSSMFFRYQINWSKVTYGSVLDSDEFKD